MSLNKKSLDPQRDVIEAAGGLLWRETAAGRQVALIHRPSHADWTLPKGKRDPGETWQETALREVREETGIKAQLGAFAGSLGYTVEGIPKVVLFWHMYAPKNDQFIVNDEVDDLIWVPLEKALELVSYTDEVGLLETCR
ncbi:MAG TPA: NUDIX hydrolase [Chloroflexi bacterium]|nr:NUDIX hydrolase [Chloroflexota bacterium]